VVIVYVQNGDVAAFSRASEAAARRYPGERIGGRNPQLYESATAVPVRDAVAVYVHARWARIVADYLGFGIPLHLIDELSAPVEEQPFATESGAGVVPAISLVRRRGRPRRVA
jgi:hypothetical protein